MTDHQGSSKILKSMTTKEIYTLLKFIIAELETRIQDEYLIYPNNLPRYPQGFMADINKARRER